MKTCGIIQQKKVNGNTSTSISRDKWNMFLSQYKLNNVEISMSKLRIVDSKLTRKNMPFIRIGTKSSLSYSKPATQYTHQVLPTLIKMRQLTHLFLNSISTDILETINWSENERVSVPTICKKTSSNCSKPVSTSIFTSTSTSTSHDNPPILPSLYPILDEININPSKLDDKPLNVIYLKNLLSEVSCILIDNNISMNL